MARILHYCQRAISSLARSCSRAFILAGPSLEVRWKGKGVRSDGVCSKSRSQARRGRLNGMGSCSAKASSWARSYVEGAVHAVHRTPVHEKDPLSDSGLQIYQERSTPNRRPALLLADFEPGFLLQKLLRTCSTPPIREPCHAKSYSQHKIVLHPDQASCGR